MRKILLSVVGLSALGVGFAQGLDLQNRILLQRDRMEKAGKIKSPELQRQNLTLPNREETPLTRSSELEADAQNSMVNAFVKIADGFTKYDLEDLGMTVNTVRGNIAIVTMPADSLESFSTKECVKKISLEKKLNSHMDQARKASGVDELHSGTNLNMPYTGKGVLAMIVDQGVDPNHISFKDENGGNRVKYLTYFNGNYSIQGVPSVNYYGEDIIYKDENGNVKSYPTVDKFYTDTYEAYHGTHTLNILGGGYKGDISIYEDGGLKDVPNRYYGVAPEADLAVSCGDLSDVCVAYGLAELISYGEYMKESKEEPFVVSMSLGSTAGPHDPNNLMNEFLTYCGEDAIIVLSSGNEGDLKIALNKTFTADDQSIKSMIYPYGFRYDSTQGQASSNNTYVRNGVVMVYSDDDTPFTLRAFVMTGSEGNYRRRGTYDISSAEGKYYVSEAGWSDYVGGSVNSTVARYFNGFMGGGTMLDEDLGRYYGAFEYYLVTKPETGINADGSEGVIIGFEIIGENGQRIDCYCDGVNTWISNYGMEDYDDGSRDGTISDMAVGDNILVVGAYNTRFNWTALDGKDYSYGDVEGFELGAIGPYSSYGTLVDGRTLPHVCAPGSAIMSAVSNPWIDYYFDLHRDYIQYNTTAKAVVGGKEYYWKPETGTSMSTPFVAGSIALWLEANPDLDIHDIHKIIEKTSVKDEQVLTGNPVQWGAGKFDALAGLKEAIALAGVEGIQADDRNDRLILTQNAPGVFGVFVGSASSLDIDVYSMAGNSVYSKNLPGNDAVLDLSGLSPGVYVLKVNRHASKILVK